MARCASVGFRFLSRNQLGWECLEKAVPCFWEHHLLIPGFAPQCGRSALREAQAASANTGSNRRELTHPRLRLVPPVVSGHHPPIPSTRQPLTA